MQAAIHWQAYRPTLQLPAVAKSWLLDEQSLTAKLINASQQQFRVQRLKQVWGVPRLSERQALNMRPREIALIREVLLYCQEQPWVYARSILPYQSLNGSLRYLKQLHNQSLGQQLFKHPALERQAFEVAQITMPNLDIPVQTEQSLFARRSVFSLQQQKLLVAEIFLPASPLYPH